MVLLTGRPRILKAIQTGLTAEGYALDLKFSDQKVVHHAWLRFPGLLYELNLSHYYVEMEIEV